MQILQGMDADQMVIIFPSALVAMYLIISIQKYLLRASQPIYRSNITGYMLHRIDSTGSQTFTDDGQRRIGRSFFILRKNVAYI